MPLSGKSSIINLVPRFYDPTAGSITIDGHDLRRVTLASLRDQIGHCLARDNAFCRHDRANIALAVPTPRRKRSSPPPRPPRRMSLSARWPTAMIPMSVARGDASGGQKQRVAIARALLKNPRVLILDDATSSVDTATEQLIQRALARLMAGRTSFVIAQRMSTVRLPDQILVLEKGRIAAQGTHQELLERSEIYARIYYQQLKPQE
ncbi:MAG: ATP-binding cassette domain-containing protein [Caldilineaceae bacterium]